MKLKTTLSLGVLVGGLVAASGAQAVPAVPQPGLAHGAPIETVARTTKRERMMRRHNTRRHGDPNARNPERPGPAQQLGGTANGPRY